MSVRQDFIEAYAARWGCEEGYASGLLDHVLEEHAHELAEKIRLRATDRAAIPRDRLSSGECRDDWAADLIDPEVS